MPDLEQSLCYAFCVCVPNFADRIHRMGRTHTTEDDDLESDMEGKEHYLKSYVSLSQQEHERSRIIYVGHLPYGFFEDQLNGYLSQFGTVEHVVVPRSKKTNRDKGFAFVAFESPDVAEIVANTLHNFMLMKKRLICKLVPPEKIPIDSFLKSKSKYTELPITYVKAIKRTKAFAQRINSIRSKEQEKARKDRLFQRDAKKRAKFKKLGIDYDFVGYGALQSDTREKQIQKGVSGQRGQGKKQKIMNSFSSGLHKKNPNSKPAEKRTHKSNNKTT